MILISIDHHNHTERGWSDRMKFVPSVLITHLDIEDHPDFALFSELCVSMYNAIANAIAATYKELIQHLSDGVFVIVDFTPPIHYVGQPAEMKCEFLHNDGVRTFGFNFNVDGFESARFDRAIAEFWGMGIPSQFLFDIAMLEDM